jgi:hypothetical protein
MKTLIVQSASKQELKMMAALAKNMGLKTKILNQSEMEAIALAQAMDKNRTNEYVNTDTFLQKLKSQ